MMKIGEEENQLIMLFYTKELTLFLHFNVQQKIKLD